MQRIFLYIVSILALLTSCHSSKKMVTSGEYVQYQVAELYDSLKKNFGDYSTLSMKFSIDSKDLKMIPFQIKGSIRVKKDSLIWISIAPSAMNIEVIRCIITKDSVKLYSKLQKTSYFSHIDSLSQRIEMQVDYPTIQAILLDELFFCQQGPMDTLQYLNNCEIKSKDNKSILKTYSKKEFKKNDTLSLMQTWTIPHNTMRIHEVDIANENDSDNIEIKLEYSDFNQFGTIKFPQSVNVKFKTPKRKLHMDIDYYKIEFNEDLSFPFNPSSSYKKSRF